MGKKIFLVLIVLAVAIGVIWIANRNGADEQAGRIDVPTPGSEAIGSEGTFYIYTVKGEPNGGANINLAFLADGGYPIINMALDLNDDGTYTKDEWAIVNAKSFVRADTKNNYVFDLEDATIKERDSIKGVAVFSENDLDDGWWDEGGPDARHVTLSIETFELNDILGLDVPGGGPGVYRGFAQGFRAHVPEVRAQLNIPDLDIDSEYDIPDIRQDAMECGPTSIANNMIGLAAANGRSGDLPSPETMIDQLKDDLKFGDEGKAGVLDKNYIAGKNAFMRRYSLPIVTEEIQNPSFDDIADALADGAVIEMDLAFIDASAGNAHVASHLVTVTGVSSDGGDFTIRGRDSATPDGHESWSFFPKHDRQPTTQMHYPLWRSATVINKIYVQRYVSVDDAVRAGVLSAGAVGSTFPVEMLVIDGNYYPKNQFRIGNNPQDNCKAPHYHKDTAAHGLRNKTDTVLVSKGDPAPDSCGFGKVSDVPVETIRITFEQQQALAGALTTP